MSVRAMTPILICYDGSAGARRAIETAGGLFPGRRAIVLHAWSPMAILGASYLGTLAMLGYDDEVAQADASKIAEEGCNLAKRLVSALNPRSQRSPSTAPRVRSSTSRTSTRQS